VVKLFVFCVHFSLCIVFVFWLIRSYKNGFVWHDLCEDDIILPAHGSEYVLKGSELFYESNSGQECYVYVLFIFIMLCFLRSW